MDKTRLIIGRIGVAALLVLLSPGCQAPDRAQRNTEIVRRMTDAINRRDFDALDGLVASDISRHSGATPGLVIDNLAQFKAFLRRDVEAVPDSEQEIELIFANDEYVAMRCTYSGTQQGPWGPFPPTGKSLQLPFIGLLRIENERVAEIWVEWDNLNALTQLGHLSVAAESDPLGAQASSSPPTTPQE